MGNPTVHVRVISGNPRLKDSMRLAEIICVDTEHPNDRLEIISNTGALNLRLLYEDMRDNKLCGLTIGITALLNNLQFDVIQVPLIERNVEVQNE